MIQCSSRRIQVYHSILMGYMGHLMYCSTTILQGFSIVAQNDLRLQVYVTAQDVHRPCKKGRKLLKLEIVEIVVLFTYPPERNELCIFPS